MNTWLDEHLETFVRPVLKHIPNIDDPKDKDNSNILRWSKDKMVICLEAVWKEAKKRSKNRSILLAGRDTWEFEILARMEGFPTTFRPDISTYVAIAGLRTDPTKGIYLFERDKPHPLIKEDYSEFYLLDSGWKGTIPKALGVKNWDMVIYNPSPDIADPIEKQKARDEHQVFPRAKEAKFGPNHRPINGLRSPILNVLNALEGSPKYWTSAEVKGNKIVQTLNLVDGGYPYTKCYFFSEAAKITQFIVKNLKLTKVKTIIDLKEKVA